MNTFQIWPEGSLLAPNHPRQESSIELDGPGGRKTIAVTDVTVPTLARYDPPQCKGHGGAVLILPGGGFRFLSVEMEGSEIADWFCERGFISFVLKYRVTNSDASELYAARERREWVRAMELMEPGRRVALADAVAAIRYVRSNCQALGIDRSRIGMIGFSAGAMTTLSAAVEPKPEDRPDFAMPIYGAMTDTAVPTDAPPLFMVHAFDDRVVPVEESLKVAAAWRKRNLSAELHVYERGGHGFGMRRLGLPVDRWPDQLEQWLFDRKLCGGEPGAVALAPADRL